MGLLEGHKAIVTGGGSGIGAATCRRMAEEGADVSVFDVDFDAAQRVAGEFDGFPIEVDVTDADAVTDAVHRAADGMGGLSIAFNNAGIGWLQPLHEFDLGMWDRVIRTSLYGVFHMMRVVAPIMRDLGDGRIVNTASISGTRPAAGEAPYSAAKAGIAALTASAALEYGPAVRVNAVSPGHISTPLTKPMEEGMPEQIERTLANTPVGRLGVADDIADVVVFLCSDLSRFVTGQNLVADGGLTLHTSGVDGLLERVYPPSD